MTDDLKHDDKIYLHNWIPIRLYLIRTSFLQSPHGWYSDPSAFEKRYANPAFLENVLGTISLSWCLLELVLEIFRAILLSSKAFKRCSGTYDSSSQYFLLMLEGSSSMDPCLATVSGINRLLPKSRRYFPIVPSKLFRRMITFLKYLTDFPNSLSILERSRIFSKVSHLILASSSLTWKYVNKLFSNTNKWHN